MMVRRRSDHWKKVRGPRRREAALGERDITGDYRSWNLSATGSDGAAVVAGVRGVS